MTADDDAVSTVVADEVTDLDSDPIEEVDSDEEFSRMMKTPSSQRERRREARNSSTPRSRESPVQRAQKNASHTLLESQNVAFSVDVAAAPSMPRDRSQFVRSDSQQTQPVAPLTASQLDRLMAGSSDVDEEGEINSSSENEPEETRQMIRSKLALNYERPIHIADQSKSINSTNPNTNTNGTHDVPRLVLSNSNQEFESQRKFQVDDADITPATFSAEVVDETPLKLSFYAEDVYLLVKWGRHDPRWWPCKANRKDWNSRNKRADVLFRDNETGFVNSDHAVDFELKPGDAAHVMRRQGKFTIKKFAESVDFPGDSCTNKGANVVTVANAKRSFDVAVADLFFTDGDLKQNLKYVPKLNSSVKRKSARSKRGRDDTNTSDLTNDDYSRADTTEDLKGEDDTSVQKHIRSPNTTEAHTPNGSRRKTRPEFQPEESSDSDLNGDDNSSAVEIRSSPLKYRPLSRRSDLKLPLHDIDSDFGINHSPPRKRRDLASRISALRKTNRRGIFADCLFTISIDSSRPEPRDGTGKSQLAEFIEQSGGKVLKDGLSEVISLSEVDADGSMPDIVSSRDIESSRFAAVLTDEPRRTVKYSEMVALGWPCSHSRYIVDCIEQGEMSDWLPYLLPAGISAIPNRTMPINANVSAFHRGWLQGHHLQEQIRKRKIAVKCSVPFCILKNEKSYTSLLLLAALCTPQFRMWIYRDRQKIPKGAVVVDITEDDSSVLTVSSPQLLYEIQNYAALDKTVYKSREWLIQSIINGALI